MQLTDSLALVCPSRWLTTDAALLEVSDAPVYLQPQPPPWNKGRPQPLFQLVTLRDTKLVGDTRWLLWGLAMSLGEGV